MFCNLYSPITPSFVFRTPVYYFSSKMYTLFYLSTIYNEVDLIIAIIFYACINYIFQ